MPSTATSLALPQPSVQERAFLALGALESGVDDAIRKLDGGARPGNVAADLRNCKELIQRLKPTAADYAADTPTENCRGCGRYLTLTSERLMAHRCGICCVCGSGPETDEEREWAPTPGVIEAVAVAGGRLG